jgi:hypothetical protein
MLELLWQIAVASVWRQLEWGEVTHHIFLYKMSLVQLIRCDFPLIILFELFDILCQVIFAENSMHAL